MSINFQSFKTLKVYKQWSNKQKEQFYYTLFILSSSGIDISSSLEIVLENQKEDKNIENIKSIINEVVTGMDLAYSMRKANCFSEYELSMVKLGESTSNMPYIFNELFEYYKLKVEQQKYIISIVIYPAFVLSISLAVIIFMSTVIVPSFAEVLNRNGTELPLITQYTISITKFITDYYIYCLLILAITFFALGYIYRLDRYKSRIQRLFIKLPFFGKLLISIELLSFFNALSVSLKAKIPFTQAIEIASGTTTHIELQKDLKNAVNEMISGHTFTISLTNSLYFNKVNLSLLSIGEEVNKLAEVSTSISVRLKSEIQSNIKILGQLIEPIIIIVLGLVVGFILVAMYLPLFKIGSGFDI